MERYSEKFESEVILSPFIYMDLNFVKKVEKKKVSQSMLFSCFNI